CIMNSKITHPAKSFLAAAVMLFLSMHAFAQLPVIKVVGKSKGSTAEVITLKGNTFGTDPTKLSVSFGAAKGIIKSLTDQLLEVQVPPGTTYDNITLTNTTSGLTSFSREEFLLSF